MIGILAAGAAAWVALSLGLLRERPDWRTAIVEYTNLYTNETFSPFESGRLPASNRTERPRR
jgi:hypothetical protein